MNVRCLHMCVLVALFVCVYVTAFLCALIYTIDRKTMTCAELRHTEHYSNGSNMFVIFNVSFIS